MLNFSLNAIFQLIKGFMDYKKKSLKKTNHKESYEEIDTRLASGWYVDDINISIKKICKAKKTPFKISKKMNS